MDEKALNLLGIARKGGKLVIGEDPVGAAARDGSAALIILAADAAGHTQRRARSFGEAHRTPLVSVDADKSRMGAEFGRSSVAMAALTDRALAKAFLEALQEPERYGEALAVLSEPSDQARRTGNRKKR